MTIVVMLFFASCQSENTDNLDVIRNQRITADAPGGEAENFHTRYTEKGILQADLKSPKMLDYSNKEFGYNEFPDGVVLEMYEYKDGKRETSTIVSDIAFIYADTDIIDMQGNVVLTTYDGKVLKSDQLYYDQVQKWLFTDKKYSLELEDGSRNDADIFDANDDFTIFLSRRNESVQYLND